MQNFKLIRRFGIFQAPFKLSNIITQTRRKQMESINKKPMEPTNKKQMELINEFDDGPASEPTLEQQDAIVDDEPISEPTLEQRDAIVDRAQDIVEQTIAAHPDKCPPGFQKIFEAIQDESADWRTSAPVRKMLYRTLGVLENQYEHLDDAEYGYMMYETINLGQELNMEDYYDTRWDPEQPIELCMSGYLLPYDELKKNKIWTAALNIAAREICPKGMFEPRLDPTGLVEQNFVDKLYDSHYTSEGHEHDRAILKFISAHPNNAKDNLRMYYQDLDLPRDEVFLGKVLQEGKEKLSKSLERARTCDDLEK